MAKRKSKRRGGSDTCNVEGCSKASYRSIATNRVIEALPDEEFAADVQRRTHLCKAHYRDFKKATRKDRKLEQMGWD